MKSVCTFITAFILFTSCNKEIKTEDPVIVARAFCDCLNEKSSGGKDTIINVNECNAVFSESRLLKIHFSEDKHSYTKNTLDSASEFSTTVRDISDTMCCKKMKFRKRRGV
jgi:hypothetical protein